MTDHNSHHGLRRQADRDHSAQLRRIADAADDKKLISSAIAQHEKHDHAGEPLTRLKLATGGHVDGHKARHRLDRPGRAAGGRTKGKHGGHTTVNVVMPQGGGQDRPVPIPVPAGAGAGGPPPGMPPRPPMPPPGVGGPPMGGPPGAPPPPMMRKRGGRAMPHLEGGSGGGEGRLEKAAAMKVPSMPENKAFTGEAEDEPFTGDAENRKRGGRAK